MQTRVLELAPPSVRHKMPEEMGAAGQYGAEPDRHDADITPETIIPPWYGERLDLDHAIYICFANAANAANAAGQASQHDNGPPPVPAAA
jgi:hypothetical protein